MAAAEVTGEHCHKPIDQLVAGLLYLQVWHLQAAAAAEHLMSSYSPWGKEVPFAAF